MTVIKHHTGSRLISAILFAATLFFAALGMLLPAHASPVLDDAKKGAEEIGDAVGDMARDAGDAVGDVARDAESNMANGQNGRVEDSDGVIGDETASQTDEPSAAGSKAGQIVLIVVIVAVIIAVIMIVALIPKRKNNE